MRRKINIFKELKSELSFVLTAILTMALISDCYSQNTGLKPSRQSAMEAFSDEKYEVAYGQFNELSKIYSKDPLYKYYCGVCLVKLKKEPARASSLLKEALGGSVMVKNIPNDGWFYLGRAQQMAGLYSEATTSYNKFTGLTGKKTAKAMGVPDYIKQSSSRKGEITESDNKSEEIVKNDTLKKSTKDVIAQVIKDPQKPAETGIKKMDLLPENYDIILSEALNYQFSADSLSRLAEEQKKMLDKLTGSEKTDLKTGISELERSAASFQNKADVKFNDAQKLRSANPLIGVKRFKPDTAVLKTETVTHVVSDEKRGIMKDTVIPVREIAGQKEISQPVNTQVHKDTISQHGKKLTTGNIVITPQGATSDFEINARSGYSADAKIEINPVVPSGLIYRIQIGIFRNMVTPSYFKGIKPVYGIRVDGTDKTIYYVGFFRKSTDAGKALIAVKGKGFKDSFIVALFDNKQISADRAKSLEKEWGGRELFAKPDIQQDTIPPTLLFRVEVTKSSKPLSGDVIESIRKIAGVRGLDILTDDTKQNIYLIGKFLTFASASEYADLITRNGFRNARVVAYLGKREIPVEIAKELFEKN